ncbi:hypothetical protein SERLADRAFT_467128 [Serpula lacrymans var. lacrymans S7.9]|uniref:Uncharacterized protein n=1 Tax=Serpula lacrymans var. lacrymans (strain S7.9) TaxID=578457 RepID=F8NY13_SERL9|nr:uncharacterized protein SERLADRAFT_467128 [Serpula lacrymans var. lacrymans S7.9]EGO24205.1 hypothetical protein SERLADRAFT_467128 [Serpula lacrymans var. lacrymans S7.9]
MANGRRVPSDTPTSDNPSTPAQSNDTRAPSVTRGRGAPRGGSPYTPPPRGGFLGSRGRGQGVGFERGRGFPSRPFRGRGRGAPVAPVSSS